MMLIKFLTIGAFELCAERDGDGARIHERRRCGTRGRGCSCRGRLNFARRRAERELRWW